MKINFAQDIHYLNIDWENKWYKDYCLGGEAIKIKEYYCYPIPCNIHCPHLILIK